MDSPVNFGLGLGTGACHPCSVRRAGWAVALGLGTLCCLSFFIPFLIKNHLPLDLRWCPACLDQ